MPATAEEGVDRAKGRMQLFERTGGRLKASPEAEALFPEISDIFPRVNRFSQNAAGMMEILPEGLSALAFWGLLLTSFIASLITVALGIGGGGLVLAVMASLVPPAALIAVHGVVQRRSGSGPS